jgi:hypothetical protein
MPDQGPSIGVRDSKRFLELLQKMSLCWNDSRESTPTIMCLCGKVSAKTKKKYSKRYVTTHPACSEKLAEEGAVRLKTLILKCINFTRIISNNHNLHTIMDHSSFIIPQIWERLLILLKVMEGQQMIIKMVATIRYQWLIMKFCKQKISGHVILGNLLNEEAK